MSKAGAPPGYGVFRVGACLIGIPIDNLAEVCSVGALSGLMTASEAVLGAFSFRGDLLPLVDIALLAGAGRYESPIREAALVQYGNRLVALAVDEVVSLWDADPTETAGGYAADRPANDGAGMSDKGLFPQGFIMDGVVVSCLDAQALFAHDEVLSVPKAERRQQAVRTMAAGTYLVLRAGGAAEIDGTEDNGDYKERDS